MYIRKLYNKKYIFIQQQHKTENIAIHESSKLYIYIHIHIYIALATGKLIRQRYTYNNYTLYI